MGKYSSIFEPLTVKQMTIPNRIVMTPMGTPIKMARAVPAMEVRIT